MMLIYFLLGSVLGIVGTALFLYVLGRVRSDSPRNPENLTGESWLESHDVRHP